MKKSLLILALALVSLSATSVPQRHWPTCRGKFPCHACKNCKHCKYCSQKGGICSVCKKNGAVEKSTNERDLKIYQ